MYEEVFEEMHQVLNERIEQKEANYIYFADVTDGLTKCFSDNIDATICFLDEEITDEQFYWLSEVFDEIAKETSSKEFVEALKSRFDKYAETNENLRKSISKCIAFAENALK